MIEYRALLSVDKEFTGGLKLKRGTVVYVWETEFGWIGNYWPDPRKLTTHSFALEEEEFSIMTSGDARIKDLVVVPLPAEPAPTKVDLERIELQRKRVLAEIRAHREEADRLDRELAKGTL